MAENKNIISFLTTNSRRTLNIDAKILISLVVCCLFNTVVVQLKDMIEYTVQFMSYIFVDRRNHSDLNP